MKTFVSLSLYLILNAVDSKIPSVLSVTLFPNQRDKKYCEKHGDVDKTSEITDKDFKKSCLKFHKSVAIKRQ